MRNYIITLLISLAFTAAKSQDVVYDSLWSFTMPAKIGNSVNGFKPELRFFIRGAYHRPVKRESLMTANSLSDISPGYPSNWLTDYISSEISATCKGKSMKARNSSGTLTNDQKNILSMVDLGSDIVINVKYKTHNSATNDIEIRTMNYNLTVIPEVEAAYNGGDIQLRKYLKDNAISKIAESADIEDGVIRFTINEIGEPSNAKIVKSTGKSEVDKLLLDTINRMPKWKPAENAEGVKVKQVFEFSVGNDGC